MDFTDAQTNQLKLLLQLQSEANKESLNRLYIDIKDIKKECDNRIRELERSLICTHKEFDDLKQTNIQLKKENETLKRR